MMSKKDKSELDLDFDELGSVQKSTGPAPKPKVTTKKTAPKSKLADIVLSIPSKGDASKFASKTIGECSGLEFVHWAKHVAYTLDKEHTHYDDETNRHSAFLRILSFHRKNFILSNPKAEKTYH